MKNLFFLLLFIPFLSLQACAQENGNTLNVNATEFKGIMKKQKGVLLDVRTPAEFQQGHISGALNIDYTNDDFKSKAANLDKEETYFVYCRSGARSRNAVRVLEEQGITNIIHLDGGILNWENSGYPLDK